MGPTDGGSAPANGEHTSLIIAKVGDGELLGGVRKGTQNATGSRSGIWWAVVVILALMAAVVVTTLALTGTFSGDDDDDDGDDEGEHLGHLDPSDPCSAASIVGEGDSIACHDPTGCGKPGDTGDWCYVSDLEQPVTFAVAHETMFYNLDRNSSLGYAAEILSHLPATCTVNACEHRRCLCTDNGNGTSHCEGIHLDDFPYTKIKEGNYPNCETSDPQVGHEATTNFAGEASNCACQDVSGCAAYDGTFPSWVTRDNLNVTKSATDRCYVSAHHDGALDACAPGACGMIFPCECVDFGNGTSSCATALPYRDVEVIPNCEAVAAPPSPPSPPSPSSPP